MTIDGVNFTGDGRNIDDTEHYAPAKHKIDPAQHSNFQQELERVRASMPEQQKQMHKGEEKKASETDDVSKEADGKGKTVEDEQLMKAARQFEALFIQQMLQGMRETVPESELIDGGMAEEIYEGMLDEAYAEKMAQSGGMGLADKIYEQFTSEYAGLSFEDRTH